jgi:hypothetical protein
MAMRASHSFLAMPANDCIAATANIELLGATMRAAIKISIERDDSVD